MGRVFDWIFRIFTELGCGHGQQSRVARACTQAAPKAGMNERKAMLARVTATATTGEEVDASFDAETEQGEALLGWEQLTFDTGSRETVVAVVETWSVSAARSYQSGRVAGPVHQRATVALPTCLDAKDHDGGFCCAPCSP